MSLTVIKILLMVACLGRVLCCFFCDRAMTYTPNGRFDFKMPSDNEKMSALFDGTPLKKQLFSILAGVCSMQSGCSSLCSRSSSSARLI